MNKFELALQTQQELLNYILSTQWKDDLDKQELEVIFQKVQNTCNIKLDIDQFFSKEKQEQLKSYLYEKQQQIRRINKSLQETLNKSPQVQQSPTCVIAQLPPRFKNNKVSYFQQIHYFKTNLIELKSCHQKLSQEIELKQSREAIQKQINLLQIAENFKFELNCLESELMQNRLQLNEQFEVIRKQIEITIEDDLLQNLVSYCTAISKANIILKKQLIIIKQIYSFDTKDFYLQMMDIDKENKQTSYSQDTDVTSQQSPQKNSDQNKIINKNIRNQECLCSIF
ncbi:unnamed protein product [Paramecium sonneborni]|uniref:Uncharacterized protein n=1 Tax=Paramecium sonneborni TaxID=65129 RepID=A0A8S1NNA4_9CILI|nr:unnamed protein product [Paramecium sonneborni]